MDDPDAARLRVKLFGGPVLLRGEEEVPLSPFQTYLLALVFGHGPRGISRSKAIWLLWEEDDNPAAGHRLSQLMYQIKSRAGGRVIFRKRDRFVPDQEVQLLPAEDVGGHRGSSGENPNEFLSLLPDRPPSKALDDWIQAARVANKRSRVEDLQDALRRARKDSDYQRMASVAQRILDRTPLEVDALQGLIWSLIMDGRVDEAIQECSRRTVAAQAEDPEFRLPQNIQALLKGPRMPAFADQVRMVGRGSELHSVRTTLSVQHSVWSTIAISGDPGIGKTRFLAEVERYVRLEHVEPVSVRCIEAERTISFNVMAEMLEHPRMRELAIRLPQPWRRILAAVFPCLAAEPSQDIPQALGSDPISNARRIHDALEHLFDSYSDRLVLLIDDFHWIDASSASALNFLRRRLARSSVTVVLSVVMEALDSGHPAALFLQSLRGDHDSLQILSPLDNSEVVRLLELVFGDRLTESERRNIAAISVGVPLFAVEVAEDRLGGVAGRPPGIAETTRSAKAIFRRREMALDRDSRHMLRLLSVLGRPVSLEVLRGCSELPESSFLQAIQVLRRMRLIKASESCLEFRHQLIRGAVYTDLSDASRRLYHLRVANFLRSTDGVCTTSELAHHFSQAGANHEAYGYAVLAADEACDKGAFEDARVMLELAVSTAKEGQERLRCLRQLAAQSTFQGHYTDAVSAYNEAATAAQLIGSSREAMACRLGALNVLVDTGRMNFDSAMDEANRLASAARDDGDLYNYLTALDLSIRLADYSVDASSARTILAQVDAVDIRRSGPEVRCLRESIRTRHICYGDPTEAVAAARAAVQIAESHNLAAEFGKAVKRFLVVLGYRGLLDGEEGTRQVETAKTVFQRTGDQRSLFDVLINFAVWLYDTGRFSEARGYLDQANSIVRNLEDSPEYAIFASNMGECLLYQGEYLVAKQYYKAAWTARLKSRRPTTWVAAGGLGLAALETGELGLLKELDEAIPSDERLLATPAFDPTPIALFRARNLERQRQVEKAVELLATYSRAVRYRIIPAWLKIRLAECELCRKHGLKRMRAAAIESYETAVELGLQQRARDFKEYIC